MCLDKYKEKFFKTDSYLNMLFDEIGEFLNKLANCLNELNRSEKEPNILVNEQSLDELGGAEPTSPKHLSASKEEATFALTKAKKKFMQENLNSLNKTISLARKSMIDLIITSTMIGGLKQVRENERAILLNI